MAVETKACKIKRKTGKHRTYPLWIILFILTINLAGCGSSTEDILDASENAKNMVEGADSETADETALSPQTYEDYKKLAEESYGRQDWETALSFYQGAKELDDSREEAYRGMSDVYLQMDDVVEALAILDEGMEKCGDKYEIDHNSQSASGQSSLRQRKEYVLARLAAVGTNRTENQYDSDGSLFHEIVWEGDENGNQIRNRSVYYDEGGEISYLAEHQYDGNGKQIECKYIDYDSDGGLSSYSHETWTYDTNGKEIECAEYDEDGKIEKRTEYEYDTNGKQIKETNYDKDDKIERQVKIEYDAAGNEIRWECYDENGRCSIQRIYTRDEFGKLVQYYENFGGYTKKEEYERDESGKIIKSVYYDDDGIIRKICEYEYDEMGRKIKDVTHEEDGTVGYWCEYEYDEDGREIKFKSYNSTGNLEYRVSESKYDENGRLIYESHEKNGVVTEARENEYGEDGNIRREMLTNYDSDTGQKTYERICEYTFDEKGNMTKYDFTCYEEAETKSLRWEKEYDEEERETGFYFYDNEKAVSYQGRPEYDENGLMINYRGYDKNENILARRETEYDASGNVIRAYHYDADGNLIRYYENEYDDLGSITRQTMYEDDILKSEKLISYAYHYIGNIDAEPADYIDNDMTPEEYNQKQREIFTRFLEGGEMVRYCRNVDNSEDGKIVEESLADLIDFGYIRQYKKIPEYTFLDMTGDGIEELIIRYGEDERICVIQCSYGTLKVIFDTCGSSAGNTPGIFLVKYNGRTGICRDYGMQSGEDRNYYYFLDGKGEKEIFLAECMEWTGSFSYRMCDNDGFEERDISKGEYYDITGGMTARMDIDWQKLEEPLR